MEYYLNGVKQTQALTAPPGREDDPLLCLAESSEKEQALSLFGLPIATEPEARHTTRYEAHNGFDYLSIGIPNTADLSAPLRQVEAYFTDTRLLILGAEHPAVQRLQKEVDGWQGAEPVFGKVLYLLFSNILLHDAAFLDDMEEHITRLEEEIVEDRQANYTRQIIRLRRQLLILKRYYESLYDLLEDLEENQNGFFSKQQLRAFRMHTNRADRLAHTVLNLRDYVTQVREAYQNQLDIGLNRTMRLFTVITTIFLPLTLIAGWFGMNLQMPEYNMPYAYPVVIALSAIVVFVCIWYFKKKKWF